MKIVRVVFLLVSLFISVSSSSQIVEQPTSISVDSLKTLDLNYREDQFYIGITHTLVQDKPSDFSPYSFSLGISGGFLRDFPVNESRTLAIAPGIGYSYLNLRSNLGVTSTYDYQMLSKYKQSALSLHYIDIPIELRWRNSTAQSHKFWRVYLGFKASYLFSSRFKTVTDQYSVILNNDKRINKWQYGLYASVGFNTWNLHMYYGLNKIYDQAVIQGDPAQLRMINLGLMFYIL